MNKIIFRSHQVIWLFFFSVIFQCEAKEPGADLSEKAFYAISSLCYHLEEITSSASSDKSSKVEPIAFDEEDVISLWESAALHPLVFSEVEEAQHLYYNAKEKNDRPALADEIYLKAKCLLRKAWKKTSYANFDDNPIFTIEMQQQIRPYLLPLEHPAKIHLDNIFANSGVLENESSFANAGFETLFAMPYSFIRVARHPDLPGYILKVYLDSEFRKKKNRPGWLSLTLRCVGAENIRNLINEKKFIYFSVPDKWIYPLPANPADQLKLSKQPVILIETDMNLVSKEETRDAWLNKITYAHLDELYCILSHGYGSSGLVRNVPYTKDGKFAFVDTERPRKTPKYAKARKNFSKEMQKYWDKLVKNGGKYKK